MIMKHVKLEACGQLLTHIISRRASSPDPSHATQSSHATKSSAANGSKYNRIVCSKRKRTTEFCPLEVWRARGFDTQLIVENTTPDYIKEHPQLGKLYGVSLDVEDEVCESSIWEGQARIRDPEQYRIAQSETAVPDGARMNTVEEVMQWPSNRKPPIQFVHITCGNQSKPSFEM